jgi:hypothetical protein
MALVFLLLQGENQGPLRPLVFPAPEQQQENGIQRVGSATAALVCTKGLNGKLKAKTTVLF